MVVTPPDVTETVAPAGKPEIVLAGEAKIKFIPVPNVDGLYDASAVTADILPFTDELPDATGELITPEVIAPVPVFVDGTLVDNGVATASLFGSVIATASVAAADAVGRIKNWSPFPGTEPAGGGDNWKLTPSKLIGKVDDVCEVPSLKRVTV